MFLHYGWTRHCATVSKMADEEEDPLQATTQGNGPKRPLIDSARIRQAEDDDTKHELGFLGISVFNQDEFEAGVMRQLDEEAARKNVEQRRRLLEKELKQVKKDISEVRTQLVQLEKHVQGLLAVAVPNSSIKLREVEAAREAKENQLQVLTARQKGLEGKLLILQEEPLKEETESGANLSESAFNIPISNSERDHWELVQRGLVTPFGSTVTESHSPSPFPLVHHDLAKQDVKECIPANEGSGGIVQGEGDSDMRYCERSERNVGGDGTRDGNGDGFPLRDLTEIPLSNESGDASDGNKETAVMETSLSLEANVVPGSDTGLSAEALYTSSEDKMEEIASAEKEEVGEEDYVPDGLDWSAEESSEYSSVEEGSEGCGGVAMEDESEGERRPVWKEEKKTGVTRGRPRKRLPKHLDDGDVSLYRDRIRKWKAAEAQLREEGTAMQPDMEFIGGLTIPGSIWHHLYKYQQTGVKWLWELHQQAVGGVMGDEMGLGKTIQMIAFLAGLKYSKLRSQVTSKLGLGPVLVACPATVMHQWVKEFHTWWAPFRVAVLHDTGTFTGHKKRLIADVVGGNGVLVLTYEGMRVFRDFLLPYQWEYIVLDEGHKIRNPDAEVTLVCKQFRTPHRLILTGSPMQNNLKELWSLFDFVFPGKLGTLPVFMEEFSVPITQGGYANASEVQVETAYRCACVLRDSIAPYLLRRLKADVKLQLPKKNEQVLFCRLSEYQRELYEDFLRSSEFHAMLKQRLKVFSGLSLLRKLCNHPDLMTTATATDGDSGRRRGGGQAEGASTRVRVAEGVGPHTVAGPLEEDEFGYWGKAGKMVVVQALLSLWKTQGHKVLVFTQGTQMLNILEKFIAKEGYSYLRMDGMTTIASRQPLITEFNTDPDIFVFLLTTRVGGLGVNLTGADRVVIYDPDWNPSVDTQARERAWRIGQTQPVTIYRLLTAGTIEEKIYHRQIFKQYLTNRILKDPRQQRLFKSNDLMDLFTLGNDTANTATETSAIFAGTGADVKQKRPPKGTVAEGTRGSCHNAASPKEGRRRGLLRQAVVRKDVGSGVSARDTRKARETGQPTPKSSRMLSSQTSTSGTSVGGLGGCRARADIRNNEVEGVSSLVSQGSDSVHGSTVSLKQETQVDNGAEGLDEVRARVKDQGKESAFKSKGTKSLEEIRKMWQLLASSGSEGSGITVGTAKEAAEKKAVVAVRKGKERSRKRGVEVEGATIEGVERQSVYKVGQASSEDVATKKRKEATGVEQDDHVLALLFSKGGVHSALHHDKVTNPGHADYVLVESEAKRVAQQAAKVLSESRQQCLASGPASWGLPTWTGQHGTVGRPEQRVHRFGSPLSGQASQPSNTSTPFGHRGVETNGSTNTSSSVLLAKMSSRNSCRSDLNEQSFASGATAPPTGARAGVSEEHAEFLRELRRFIAVQANVNGQATTEEILHHFNHKVPAGGVAIFKSLLNEICTFYRQSGRGIWYLKEPYR